MRQLNCRGWSNKLLALINFHTEFEITSNKVLLAVKDFDNVIVVHVVVLRVLAVLFYTADD